MAMPSALPAALPRQGGPVSRAVGRGVLALLGWRIEGELPNIPKLVAIAAPHTSNWDFIVGIAAKFALGVRASWLGKDSLFRGPAGVLFRAWGGIPVDRTVPHDTVARVAERFAREERFVLALAPEGTRKPVAEWRTGFWHIAHQAGVPIVPIVLDWPRKRLRIGAPLELGGDLERDLRALQSLYEGVPGKIGRLPPDVSSSSDPR
jgi:1-acyl-sn-glycerol-3-phosphate acyltransferase